MTTSVTSHTHKAPKRSVSKSSLAFRFSTAQRPGAAKGQKVVKAPTRTAAPTQGKDAAGMNLEKAKQNLATLKAGAESAAQRLAFIQATARNLPEGDAKKKYEEDAASVEKQLNASRDEIAALQKTIAEWGQTPGLGAPALTLVKSDAPPAKKPKTVKRAKKAPQKGGRK